MSAKRIEITVSEETWGRLNAARGHEPRASFVKRALERALAPVVIGDPPQGPVDLSHAQQSAAPSRASEPYKLPPSAPTPKPAVVPHRESSKAAEVPTLKRGSAVAMDYRCPEVSCPRRFGSPQAVCRDHGRKAVKA